MPEEVKVLRADSTVQWAESNCFAHWWQMAEALCMRHISDFACQKPLSHFTKAFDGARVDRTRFDAEEAAGAMFEPVESF